LTINSEGSKLRAVILDYYDGYISPEITAHMDIELELRKITEAYMVEHNIPIKRQFTHEELESALKRVREAIALQQPLELSDFSPHTRSTYWDEKAKDRREEFAHSDACSKAGVAE
jgi:hypothetical protein